jgi:hypothetical protein
MLLGRKVRLYPTRQQYIEFSRYAGAARFAWNESLALCREYYTLHRAERDALYTAVYNVEIMASSKPEQAEKIAKREIRAKSC